MAGSTPAATCDISVGSDRSVPTGPQLESSATLKSPPVIVPGSDRQLPPVLRVSRDRWSSRVAGVETDRPGSLSITET